MLLSTHSYTRMAKMTLRNAAKKAAPIAHDGESHEVGQRLVDQVVLWVHWDWYHSNNSGSENLMLGRLQASCASTWKIFFLPPQYYHLDTHLLNPFFLIITKHLP